MSIRIKIIFWTISVLLVLIGIIVFTYTKSLLLGFSSIEQDRMRLNVGRVTEAIGVEVDNLNTKLADWSTWNDTYEFMGDKNEKYIESNLQGTTLENLTINYIVFLDTKDNVFFEKGRDMKTNQDIPVPDIFHPLVSQATKISSMNGDLNHAGILLTNVGLVIYAARPILHSDETGPSMGTILFGKIIDADLIEHIGSVTKLSVSIDPLSTLTSSQKSISDEFSLGSDIIIKTPNREDMNGYTHFLDPSEHPVALISVFQNRGIYQQGIKSVTELMGIGVGCAGVFILMLLFLQERLVIRRIIRLNDDVHEVQKNPDPRKRVYEEKGRDEIARLTQAVNLMLQSLEETQYRLSEEQGYIQTYIDTIGVIVVVLNSDGAVHYINSEGSKLVGYTPAELVGKNWFDTCVPESERSTTRRVFQDLMGGVVAQHASHENKVVTRDGKERIILWKNNILKDSKGTVTGSVSTGEDVTDQWAKQESLKSKALELERVNRFMVGREYKMAELKKELSEARSEIDLLKKRIETPV